MRIWLIFRSFKELSRGPRERRTPSHFGNVLKAPFCTLIEFIPTTVFSFQVPAFAVVMTNTSKKQNVLDFGGPLTFSS